jgi:hypothetical protein
MPPKEKKDKESSKAKDDKLKGKGKAKDRGEATNEDLVQDALAVANGRPVISSGQDASASQSVGASSKGQGLQSKLFSFFEHVHEQFMNMFKRCSRVWKYPNIRNKNLNMFMNSS